jgi:hypothetical protein
MIFVWVAGTELDLRRPWINRVETSITAGLALAMPFLWCCRGQRHAGSQRRLDRSRGPNLAIRTGDRHGLCRDGAADPRAFYGKARDPSSTLRAANTVVLRDLPNSKAETGRIGIPPNVGRGPAPAQRDDHGANRQRRHLLPETVGALGRSCLRFAAWATSLRWNSASDRDTARRSFLSVSGTLSGGPDDMRRYPDRSPLQASRTQGRTSVAPRACGTQKESVEEKRLGRVV